MALIPGGQVAHSGQLISVIVPVRDGELYINECLHSICSQTHTDLDIIVVDDNSVDSTRDIIAASVDARVRLVRSSGQGAAAARNEGIRHARGSWIAFLDADDLWEERKLECQLPFLLGGAETRLAFGHVQEFLDPRLDPQERASITVRRVPGMSVITLLAHSSVINSVGPFSEDLPSGEFLDWYARALTKGITHTMIPDVVAYRRIHSTNRDRVLRESSHSYPAILRKVLQQRRESP